MISYAQNREDVMLARAFRGQAGGFYVDIGAWDPELDSVTKHFYDSGWHGINVEPVDEYYRLLVRDRPRDVNLPLAVGERSESRVLYRVADSGLSTLCPSGLDAYRELGLKTDCVPVETVSLAEICDRHVDRGIDFLKIDVEGFEREVIFGGDWRRHRPRIVVVEAVVANPEAFLSPDRERVVTPEPSWSGWEPRLLENDYLFAYFDGLNRFYVRHEDEALLKAFRCPPNPFDRIELASVRRLRQELAAASAGHDRATRALRAQIGDLERSAAELAAERDGLRQELDRYRKEQPS